MERWTGNRTTHPSHSGISGLAMQIKTRAMFTIDQSPRITSGHNHAAMRSPESYSKEVLAIRCPTCAAPPGARRELTTGQARGTPHRDRRLKAKNEELPRPNRRG
jgi:hypothetical protein